MNLFLFCLFTVICFVIVGVATNLFHKDAIFTIAIGAVIGANVYNIGSYPITIGGLVFGIDGVVYCVFLFCLLTMFIYYGEKDMKTNLYTALFSIFFTALLSFFGGLFQNQTWQAQIWSTMSFIFSIVATYATVVVMINFFKLLQRKKCNHYVAFGVCMLVGNLINSIIYFGLTFLISGGIGEAFVYSLLGSAITKFVSTLICVLLYYIYEINLQKKLRSEK